MPVCGNGALSMIARYQLVQASMAMLFNPSYRSSTLGVANGQVAEWLKALAWKASLRVKP